MQQLIVCPKTIVIILSQSSPHERRLNGSLSINFENHLNESEVDAKVSKKFATYEEK